MAAEVLAADGKVHAGARAGFSVLDCGEAGRRAWSVGGGVIKVRERETERERAGEVGATVLFVQLFRSC